MFTEHWFDWLEGFPIWLQFIIAIPIGFILITIIVFSIFGIKKEIAWIIDFWERRR